MGDRGLDSYQILTFAYKLGGRGIKGGVEHAIERNLKDIGYRVQSFSLSL